MTGAFSVPPLEAMLAAGIEMVGVVLPADQATAGPLPRQVAPPRPAPSELPIVNPYLEPNILHLAWGQNVPVWEAGSLSAPATLATFAALRPDVIVIACFTRLFPAALRHLPPAGCFNLHPSLLPAYRGPAPLFWQARQEARQTGITLHWLDEGVDTGDIVAQTALDWPEEMTGAEIEQRCAVEGARLLLVALRSLDRGEPLPRQPQPQAGSSYYPWPTAEDLLIPTTWPAQRAFNFARGAAGWPLAVQLGSERCLIRVVKDYDPGQRLDQPYIICGSETWLQFNPGVLKCKL
jgi:methionyl-tRNA formyltransferase